mmetsp:Transcript_150044/g.418052  ORF Transcript_150044/g.418052 Transcript_150044/m.418052 type:complete len:417 (-) Transcript_150044:261-1511(-)
MDAGLCLLFAAAGGLLTSAANNVVAFVQQQCGEGGRCCKCLLFGANIFLNLAGIACFLAGARHGPVAVVMPILTAAKLLSSMIFTSAVGLAKYSKEKRVGTLVLSLSALCLIEVGPTDLPGQPDVEALLTEPVAVAWLVAMGAVLASSLAGLHAREVQTSGELQMVLLSAVVAVSTALGASVGKLLSVTEGLALALCIGSYFACGVLSFLYAALAAFSCDMSIFLPVSECLQLLINCATGLFIWGDGGRVRAKLSYLLVYLLICLGVYLCSTFDTANYWSDPDLSEAESQTAEGDASLGSDWTGHSAPLLVGKKGLPLLVGKKRLEIAFKRQRRIVLDSWEGATSASDVHEQLRRELLRHVRVDADAEALVATMRGATEVVEEILKQGLFKFKDARSRFNLMPEPPANARAMRIGP